ncbi:MAG: hypothetical protein AAFX96_00100, partial [Pseudomonadota bacterium]
MIKKGAIPSPVELPIPRLRFAFALSLAALLPPFSCARCSTQSIAKDRMSQTDRSSGCQPE